MFRRKHPKHTFPSRAPTVTSTDHINTLLKKCSYDTWVIVDLDNTVMEAHDDHDGLGSDQWFEHIFKHSLTVVNDKAQAKNLVMTIYNEVQMQTKMQPVDKKIGLIIRRLQHIGIPVIALTARGVELEESTVSQLNSINIHLTKFFDNKPILSKVNDNEVHFKNGIVFCAGGNKGDAISQLLEDMVPVRHSYIKTLHAKGNRERIRKTPQLPKHIIMIDDKRKHVDSVHRAVVALDASFDGLHYTHLDSKVANFKIEPAAKQLSLLYPRLTDAAKKAVDDLKLLEVVTVTKKL